MRGVRRFELKGKLNPRYIGPFWIPERKDTLPYKVELLDQLSRMHNVSHVFPTQNARGSPHIT